MGEQALPGRFGADSVASMIIAAIIVTLVVAALHVGFFYMETLAWESPRVRAIFQTDPEFAAKSKVLAANQGVYNLAFALLLLTGVFFGAQGAFLILGVLAAIVAVGLYGTFTVSRRILHVQALPAALALILWTFA
jgi:putative membrane protein